MLEDLYENNGYEVLKTSVEDISASRKSTKKCQKPASQQTTEEKR